MMMLPAYAARAPQALKQVGLMPRLEERMMQPIDCSADISPDELGLARFVSSKFARALQGALSVGIGGIASGMPETQEFLLRRFQILDALAVVLGTVSGNRSATEATLYLREPTRSLRSELNTLCHELISLQDRSVRASPAAIRRTKQPLERVASLLVEYAQVLGMEPPLIREAEAQSLELLDWLADPQQVVS